MATAKVEDEEKDVLTCTVCLDNYTDPCTLHCKHSFCRKCITDFVKTQQDAVQNKTIPCPSCRQVTRVLDPARPVDEWAGQLKPGKILLNLLHVHCQKITTDVSTDEVCSLCEHVGETTPGISWCIDCELILCERCTRIHRVQAVSRKHDQCDLGDKDRVRRRKLMCKEHNDEQIKFYCEDCDKMLCTACSVVNHRNCKSIVTMTNFYSKMKQDLENLNCTILNLESKERAFIDRQNTKIAQLKRSTTTVINEIRSASQKAIDQIKIKEQQLIDELEEITDSETQELQADVKMGNIQIQTYRQYSEYIKQGLSSDSEVDVCDVFLTWKSGHLDIGQEKDRGTERGRIESVRFPQKKQNISDILSNLHLGELSPSYPVCDITVVVVGGINTIVVTDYNNKCVKSFYTKNNKPCHSRLLLDNKPCGITQLKDNQMMVAVPDSRQIVTVAVTPDLVLLSTIRTCKMYYIISVLGSTSLAAGGINCVDILNMEGEVTKSVTTHNNKELFTYPFYMCVSNKGHLLVSDCMKKTVTCLTSEGDVIWIYSGTGEEKLSNPRGITTTSGGDILVVDRDLEKVIQLSESGQYVRDVLTSQDGLSDPRGICVDKEGSIWFCDNKHVNQFISIKTYQNRRVPVDDHGTFLVCDDDTPLMTEILAKRR